MLGKSGQRNILEMLQDRETAAEYLTETLARREVPVFGLALRNTIEAQGGLREVLQKSTLSPERIEDILHGRPLHDLEDVVPVLQALGMHIVIEARRR